MDNVHKNDQLKPESDLDVGQQREESFTPKSILRRRHSLPNLRRKSVTFDLPDESVNEPPAEPLDIGFSSSNENRKLESLTSTDYKGFNSPSTSKVFDSHSVTVPGGVNHDQSSANDGEVSSSTLSANGNEAIPIENHADVKQDNGIEDVHIFEAPQYTQAL